MGREPITQISNTLCIGCGTCVEICPSETLSLVNGKAEVTGSESMQCGQCAAICPVEAISLLGIADMSFEGIEQGSNAETLTTIMKNRRSHRLYTDKPVDSKMLENLVNAGVLAPSGTNSQKWTFTVLETRSSVIFLAERIAAFFEKVNKLAENRFLRFFSKLFWKDSLGKYYRRHYKSVKTALDRWKNEGRDQLFHGATAAIVIAEKPGASCAAEDALLASENIVLIAHALGLGTCLIGFAVEAMKRDLSIQESLGIPGEEKVYAVIAVGHPAVSYHRPSGRKPPLIRKVK